MVGGLGAVACPSPTECEAVGAGTRRFAGVALLTTDGGATWTVQKLPPGTGGLAAVACPSASICQAGGLDASASAGKVLGTTDAGRHWVTEPLAPTGRMEAISCVVSTCEAVGRSADRYSGDALRTTDGGRTWTIQHMPGGIGVVNSVDCISALICQAVGGNPSGSAGDAVHTTNGGSTWDTEGLPGIDALSALACTSAVTSGEVAGVGVSGSTGIVVVSQTAAGPGKATASPPASAISAAPVWPAPPPRRGARRPAATRSGRAATPSTSRTGAWGSTRGLPAVWAHQKLPARTGALNALSCPSPSICETVGVRSSERGGVALRTVDAGADWVSQKLPAGVDGLNVVACRSALGLRSGGRACQFRWRGGWHLRRRHPLGRPSPPARDGLSKRLRPALRPWTVMRSAAPGQNGPAPPYSPKTAVKSG